ncbi:peptidylprolyl isomerase [Aliiroseovarius sp.]|uniref:peptidylprolyl isomerase n=1 Tax=Aliiroseovarius sp. TaxID=1872442 RepID=UPI00262EFAFD|nr:peptidylprolyl isomerase [Aliiroseovarius sp.]
MPKDRLIALVAFLSGAVLVVGYMLWATFFSSPVTPDTPVAEAAATADTANPRVELVIEGEGANGAVVLELFADVAPKHVEQILALAAEGQYDNVVFHRVIEGFMAQTGDVQFGKVGGDMRMAGRGGSDRPDLPAEFSEIAFDAGIVGMARSQNPNSANSQFFIMFDAGYFLNGDYTVVGKVAEGMDVVNSIKRGEGQNGAVIGQPDVMKTVRVIEAPAE